MSAKIYDLFVEDEFTGKKRPNVSYPQEYMVVCAEGAEAIFLTMIEAINYYTNADLDPTRRVIHFPATKPIVRSA